MSSDWHPNVVKTAINFLKPENMLIFIESKTFTNVVDQVEKWYGGEFTVESLEKSFLNDLANRESNPKFAIPGPNIFMPDNFEIEKLETGENDDLG